jgi:SAM-dependent methyltransferase
MISLSQEWAILSRYFYGQEFIDELAEFLKREKINELLECGCGDGNVLRGLAEKGFYGLGIDTSSEMISMALKYNQHPNIIYQKLNWLDLEQISKNFDAVMCRGNSLASCISWETEDFNPDKAYSSLQKSLCLMFNKLKNGGLLYLDTVSQREIDNNGGEVEFNFDKFYLKGKIEYDWKTRTRKAYGQGIINGEFFSGGASSYLIRPEELEDLLKSFNPPYIWRPELKNEINYQVICAKK